MADPTKPKTTPIGWPAGQVLVARNGTRYVVAPCGSLVNIAKHTEPKPTKKERNRARRIERDMRRASASTGNWTSVKKRS